jgi:inositol-pentakisphosphate 2-kinase
MVQEDGATDVIATLKQTTSGALSLHPADTETHAPHESRVKLTYFAEGAANVIFSITLLHLDDKPAAELSWAHKLVTGHLLRLRKGEKAPDHHEAHQSVAPPPFVPVKEIDTFLRQHVLVAIPEEHVVQHILVEVDPLFVELCNGVLTALEKSGGREPKRRGWHVNTEEPYGFLVADMTAKTAQEITIEFKPKWLAQSPLAPENSRRCRTCAWHVKNGLAHEKRYCPLALVSGSTGWVRPEVEKFLPKAEDLPKDWDREATVTTVVSYFCDPKQGLELMRLLEKLQLEWDPKGMTSKVGISADNCVPKPTPDVLALAQRAINDPSNNGFERLSWTMTLRDCIIFIRLSNPAGASKVQVEAKLADLDLKRVEADKLAKWALDETGLLLNGFYAGSEQTSNSTGADDICLLWNAPGRELYEKYDNAFGICKYFSANTNIQITRN